MKIADLEIQITDNAKTTSMSIKELANSFKTLKESSKGSFSKTTVNNLQALVETLGEVSGKKFKGIYSLTSAIGSLNSQLQPLAETLKEINKGFDNLGLKKISAKPNLSVGTATAKAGSLAKGASVELALDEQTISEGITEAESNFSRFTSEVNNSSEAVGELSNKLKEINGEEIESPFVNASDNLGSIEGGIRETSNSFYENASRSDLLRAKLEMLRAEMEATENEGRKLSLAFQIQNTQAQLDRATIDEMGTAYEGLKEKSGFASTAVGRTITQFMRLFKLKLLRNIIQSVMKGFTEGLKNTYYWAKEVGNGFADSMDTIKTSTQYMQNSIGSMIAPLVNALAPVLDWLIDRFVDVINIINQFFALLGGQGTYIKALKKPVEWGDDIKDSAGGAKDSVEELKRTILGFDEINQLNGADTGGSGGGSGGSGGKDYSTLFEETEITQTVANIGKIFTDLLPVIAGIGTGILAWKISDAFGGSLSLLKSISVGVSIGGFVLEATGAYKFGKNKDLTSAIEALVGAGLGIAGAFVAFGATSLAVTIPLAIIIGAISFTKGINDASFEKTLASDLEFSAIVQSVTDLKVAWQGYKDSLVDTAEITRNYKSDLAKLSVAQGLVDKIEELAGKSSRTAGETNLMKTYIKQLNDLNLENVKLEFNELTGEVEGSLGEIKLTIEELKKLAKTQYYQDMLSGALYNQAIHETDREQTLAELDTLITKYNELYNLLFNEDGTIKPVDPTWTKEQLETWENAGNEITYCKEQIDLLNDHLSETDELLEDDAKQIEFFTDKLEGADDATSSLTEAQKPAREAINKMLQSSTNAKNALDKYRTVAKSAGTTMATLQSKGLPVSRVLDTIKTSAINASSSVGTINSTLNSIGSGVNFTNIGEKITKGFDAVKGTSIGDNIKSRIEASINKTGNGVDATNANDKTKKAFGSVSWSPIGVGIRDSIDAEINKTGTKVTYWSISDVYKALSAVFTAIKWSLIGVGIVEDIISGIKNTFSGTNSASTRSVMPMAGSSALSVASIPALNSARYNSVASTVNTSSTQPVEETVHFTVYMDSEKVAQKVEKGKKALNRRYAITVQ